jgi:hypothetical protein
MSKLAVNRNGTVLAGGKGLTAFSLNAVPSYLAGPVVLDAKLPSLYMNQAYNSNGFSEPAPNLIDGFTFKSNDPNATFATEPGTGLPFNINLSSNGSVSGYISAIPGYPGPHTVGVQAIDKNSSPGTTPFTMRVIDLAYMVEPSGFSLPSAQAGEAYAGYQFSAITEQPEPPNVKSPLQFSLVSGSLPPGLSLTSDGKVTGQVSGSAQGTYHFKVAPSNYSYSAGYTNLQPESYTIAVATPASPIMKGPFDLGHVTAGTAYSNTFQATSNPQTFSFSNASLGATQPGQHKVPAGLALNAATGELSPFVDLSVGAGPYVFDIFATNAGGPGTPATYTLTVDEPPLPIMQGPFELAPNAFYGDAYAYQFGATGGPIADYRFDTTTINSTTVSSVPSQVTDGIVDTYCIPNNLTLGSIDSAGKLSGSIDSGIGGGEYIFKVQAKNAHGWGPLARYTLIVESPPVWDPANNAPNGAHKPNDAYLNQVDYSWTPLVYGYPALHFQFSQAPGKKPSPAHSSGSNAYPWGLQIDQDTGRLFSNSDHPLGFEDASHDTLGTGNYSFYIDISNTHNTITVPVRIRVVQHQ